MVVEDSLTISITGGLIAGIIVVVIFECVLLIQSRLKRKQEINEIRESIMKAFSSSNIYELIIINNTAQSYAFSIIDSLLTSLDLRIKHNSTNIKPQDRYDIIYIIYMARRQIEMSKEIHFLPGIDFYKSICQPLQDIKSINLPKNIPFLDTKNVTLRVIAWCTVCNMKVDLLINADISKNIPTYDADSLECQHCKNTKCLTDIPVTS